MNCNIQPNSLNFPSQKSSITEDISLEILISIYEPVLFNSIDFINATSSYLIPSPSN